MTKVYRRFVLFVALVPCSAPAASAQADDLWVAGSAPTCSDARGAEAVGARATPWCTLRRAASQARPGDVVHVASGTYRGTTRPLASGTARSPIRYVAADRGVVLDADGAANALQLIGVRDVDFKGFEVRGATGAGVWVERTDGVRLHRLTIRDNPGSGISVKRSSDTVVYGSTISRNGHVGIFERSGTTLARYTENAIHSNGLDGSPYNGDGVQLSGTSSYVARNRISNNGDPGGQFEHGVYTAPASRGWTIEDNEISGNAGANLKAAGGPGMVRRNRMEDGRYGIVVSDNPRPVIVENNAISGRAQHLVFVTAGATPARARLWSNTIDQTGGSTAEGDASAVFVNAAASLELRNNIVCYSNPDSLGVALWVNSAARLGSLTSDTNWLCGHDARSRDFAWNGSRTSLTGWRTASGQDAQSLSTAPPSFDADLRVTSANRGAERGDNLGLPTDIAGIALPTLGPVDIGAHQDGD